MRVILPAATENPVLAAPDFEAQWQALLKRIGALASYPKEQGRLQHVLLDTSPSQITPIAAAVFRLVGVKPEFLPEIAPPPLEKSVSVLALLAAGAGLFAGAGVAQAPMSAPAPFTTAQAEVGRNAYAANCMSCHQANLGGEGDALPLAGQTFVAAWGKRTTAELYNIRSRDALQQFGRSGCQDLCQPGRICCRPAAKPGAARFAPATAVKISTIASRNRSADIQRGVESFGPATRRLPPARQQEYRFRRPAAVE